jgi:hypothetical protein
MTEYCVGCSERIRWWQKKDVHDRPWHFRCFASWETGYRTAQRFAQEENALHGYKGPWDLYGERMMLQYFGRMEEASAGRPIVSTVSAKDFRPPGAPPNEGGTLL